MSVHRRHGTAPPVRQHSTDPATLRAKPVARPNLRARTHHMRWRERIADLVANTLPWTSRMEWASRAGESVSHINACALANEADRKTLRVVDLLFLAPAERAAVLNAIEEWAESIERGDL